MHKLPADFERFLASWNAPYYRGDAGPFRRHLWIERLRDGYTIGSHPQGTPDHNVLITGATKREAAAFLRGMQAHRNGY